MIFGAFGGIVYADNKEAQLIKKEEEGNYKQFEENSTVEKITAGEEINKSDLA